MKRVMTAVMTLALCVTASWAQAGAIPGPQWRQDRVRLLDTDVFRVTFAGGSYAQVRLHSYGGTFLVLRVYDHNGNLVASDTDRSSDARATWMPLYDGVFTIVVSNAATVANSYFLSTN
jgi:hypothetical protein